MLVLAISLWLSVIQAVSPSIPRLEMQGKDIGGTCSAVVFEVDADRDAYALTAAHCVDHDQTQHFDLTANDRHAEVLVYNRLLDLAIIRFRARSEKPIEIAESMPEDGSDVMVIGYAFGVSGLVKQFGHVAQQYNRETKTTWFDTMTIFGDSGGAIVNDKGQLVAMTSHIYSGGLFGQTAHLSAAVTIDAIRDFIDAYHRRGKRK